MVYTHTALVGDGATVNISGLTAQGRYVRVWAEYLTANYLHLAEVKVYGCEPINNFNHAHLRTREETKLVFDALVYPNPSSGLLHFKWSGINASNQIHYWIFDITGKELENGRFNQNDALDISAYQSGIYLLKLSHGAQVITKQIIKTKGN